jgi:peptidyl-prolyl cis-trans isomerase B (cyclophilin B)
MRVVLCLLLSISWSVHAQPNAEKKFPVGQIKTEFGEILVWLYDQTPRHKESFINLANQGYWDSLTFNRVIKNFVAQGGCPDTDKGFSGSPYLRQLRHRHA